MGSRQQGPINNETKEKCIFRHFGIRCIQLGNTLGQQNVFVRDNESTR